MLEMARSSGQWADQHSRQGAGKETGGYTYCLTLALEDRKSGRCLHKGDQNLRAPLAKGPADTGAAVAPYPVSCRLEALALWEDAKALAACVEFSKSRSFCRLPALGRMSLPAVQRWLL